MEVGLARGLTITLSEEEYQDALKKTRCACHKNDRKIWRFTGVG